MTSFFDVFGILMLILAIILIIAYGSGAKPAFVKITGLRLLLCFSPFWITGIILFVLVIMREWETDVTPIMIYALLLGINLFMIIEARREKNQRKNNQRYE